MNSKFFDILFWIVILAALAVILWLLKGSPTLENGLISIGIFIISSEMLLWREFFKIDKSTAVSFVRLKGNIDEIKSDINDLKNGQKKIIKEVINIKLLVKPIAK